MNQTFLSLAALIVSVTPAFSDGTVVYSVNEDIEDVLFSIENEIINRGLKIDNVSHVGDMLARTQVDVGATTQLYREAQVLTFCSATLSREMMEINPANISFCPYKIFVYSTIDEPDVTHLGHDIFPEGEMKKVEALLDEIVKDAIGQE